MRELRRQDCAGELLEIADDDELRSIETTPRLAMVGAQSAFFLYGYAEDIESILWDFSDHVGLPCWKNPQLEMVRN
jgi:hypothetical protein